MTKTLVIFSALSLLAACSTRTTLRSNPPGAKVFLEGVYRGETPLSLTFPDGMDHGYKHLRMELEGYQPLEIAVGRKQDPMRLVCGYFCLVPLLWMYKWDDSYSFPLLKEGEASGPSTQQKGFAPSSRPQIDEAPPAQL